MRRYIVTGGTGLIGTEIIRQLFLRSDTGSVTSISRNPSGHKLHPGAQYLYGNILDIRFPDDDYTDLIHGANAAADLLEPDLHKFYYSMVEGTARVLKWAESVGIKNRLLLSSGGALRPTVYGRGKRQSELLAYFYGEVKIARIYAVLGVGMPLGGQFAIGHFVKDALEGRVRFYGGTSVRSYLDVLDCARYLITILDGDYGTHPLDVAGVDSITMEELARLVGKVWNVPVVKIDGPDREDIYLPDMTKVAALGLHPSLTLVQSLERIRDHYRT